MKPILFNTEMVKAILEGRKTVTRRIVKLPSHILLQDNGLYTLYADGWCYENQRLENITEYLKAPYQVNDILYVRETWGCYSENWGDAAYFVYRADYPDGATTYTHDDGIHECDLPKWKPSIHMPKEAARLFLRVTGVRVERLQDITGEQAEAEGIIADYTIGDSEERYYKKLTDFSELWDSTIKPAPDQHNLYTWYANPYVWVIEFENISEDIKNGRVC